MNLSDWTINATQCVTALLPGTDYDSAELLVQQWLVQNPWVVGGDGSDGAPSGGQTFQAAAQEVADGALGSVTVITVDVPFTVRMSVPVYAPSGSFTSDLLDAAKPMLESRVKSSLSSDGALVVLVDWSRSSSTSVDGGTFSRPMMVTADTEAKLAQTADLAGAATKYVRAARALDDSWVSDQVYIKDGSGEAATVRISKYANNTYAAPDSSATYIYYVRLDPVSFGLWSITKVDLDLA